MQIIQGDITEVIADEGMILLNKDGETTAHHLWLGILDSPDNWTEVPDEEVNADGEPAQDSLFN